MTTLSKVDKNYIWTVSRSTIWSKQSRHSQKKTKWKTLQQKLTACSRGTPCPSLQQKLTACLKYASCSLQNRNCSKEIVTIIIIPPWFQTCIYWKKLLYDDITSTHPFFLWQCHYFTGALEEIHMSRKLCLFHNTFWNHPL